jgi:hypothetical protein
MRADNDIRGAARPACLISGQSKPENLIGWRLEWWSAVRCTGLSDGFGEACQASKSVDQERPGLERWHEWDKR